MYFYNLKQSLYSKTLRSKYNTVLNSVPNSKKTGTDLGSYFKAFLVAISFIFKNSLKMAGDLIQLEIGRIVIAKVLMQ